MFKIFVIIIIAVGIFFWYPTSGDPIKKRFYRQLLSYLQNKLGQIRYKKSG